MKGVALHFEWFCVLSSKRKLQALRAISFNRRETHSITAIGCELRSFWVLSLSRSPFSRRRIDIDQKLGADSRSNVNRQTRRGAKHISGRQEQQDRYPRLHFKPGNL